MGSNPKQQQDPANSPDERSPYASEFADCVQSGCKESEQSTSEDWVARRLGVALRLRSL